MVFFLLNVFLLCFLPKAIGDGGAKRLDSYLSVESGKTFIMISINLSTFFGTNYWYNFGFDILADKRANQHLHDPNRCAG